MAAPFDASNASIFGDYVQLSGSGTAAPTGSSRGLSFIYASSSTGLEADTKLYLVNGTGSAGIIATEGYFNFGVAGDAGSAQNITDGNTLTMAGGSGLASVASATDTITFNVDITSTAALTGVADADTLLIDDGDGGTIRKITRANLLGSATAAFSNGMTTTTLSATGDVDLGNATSDTITCTGQFDSDLIPSTDSARDLGSSAKQWAELHVDSGYIDQLGAALDGNSQNATGFAALQANRVSGSVSVEGGKAYFAELSASQLADTSLTAGRVVFAASNGVLTDDSDMTFSTDTLTVTKLGAFEAAGAINFASQAMTNVNVDSGVVDNTVIGGTTAAAGTFTTLVAGGNVDLGDATSDTITATGRFDSDLVPSTDNARDLGASTHEWKDLYLDGVAYIDSLQADALGKDLDANGYSINNLHQLEIDGMVGVSGSIQSNGTISASVGLAGGTLDIASFASNWTNAGRTVADLGVVTTVDINGGTMDNVRIGAAGQAAADFTNVTCDDLTANGNVVLGNSAAADTITATGRFASNLVPSADNTRDLGGSGLEWKDLYIDGAAYIDALGEALDANGQNITGGGLYSAGRISGSVSVEGGVGYFSELSASQLSDTSLTATRVVFAGSNGVLTDDSDLTFVGDTLTATKLGAFEAAGAINFANQDMTNVDIDSGAIDGTVIGAASAAAGTFTAIVGTSLSVSDGNITNVGDIALDSISADGNDMDITLTDNRTAALEIKEGGNVYMAFNTADSGGEVVAIGKHFVPTADNTVDLGASGMEFKDLYLDGTANIDSLVADTADIDGGTIDGVTIGGSSRGAGSFTTLDANGNVTLGDASGDDIALNGRLTTSIVPKVDSTSDLGSATLQWANLYADNVVLNGQGRLDLDADDDTSIRASADDIITFECSGDDQLHIADGSVYPQTTNDVDLGSSTKLFKNGFFMGTALASTVTGAVAVQGGAGTLVTLAVAGGSVSGDVALALPSGKDVKARSFVTYSERKLKKDITPMSNALDTVKKMQGVTYSLKESGKSEVGFIADEVAQVVPEVCQFKADGTAAGLDYGRLTSILVEAIKAQQAQIDELKNNLK